MGSANNANKPRTTAVKEDPKPKSPAKWWTGPTGADNRLTLSLENKLASGKQGS